MGQTCSEWIPACFTKILHAGVLQQFSEFTCFRNALSLVCCKRKHFPSSCAQPLPRDMPGHSKVAVSTWLIYGGIKMMFLSGWQSFLPKLCFISLLSGSLSGQQRRGIIQLWMSAFVFSHESSLLIFHTYISLFISFFLMLPGQRSLKQRYPKCVAFKL